MHFDSRLSQRFFFFSLCELIFLGDNIGQLCCMRFCSPAEWKGGPTTPGGPDGVLGNTQPLAAAIQQNKGKQDELTNRLLASGAKSPDQGSTPGEGIPTTLLYHFAWQPTLAHNYAPPRTAPPTQRIFPRPRAPHTRMRKAHCSSANGLFEETPGFHSSPLRSIKPTLSLRAYEGPAKGGLVLGAKHGTKEWHRWDSNPRLDFHIASPPPPTRRPLAARASSWRVCPSSEWGHRPHSSLTLAHPLSFPFWTDPTATPRWGRTLCCRGGCDHK